MKERQRWQPEEDALLRAYVKQYGPKEWNLLSQRMSKPLDRDAKSCLERWKNYLKPGIKKGSLTHQEQTLVISLQAKYGNKWKKIASEVPGRTAKRLGKWWEVFKEKQLKEREKRRTHDQLDSSAASSSEDNNKSANTASKYDHILETFAEKYVVQPNLKCSEVVVLPSLPLPLPPLMPNLSPSSPLLSLATSGVLEVPSHNSSLPPWMSSNSSSSSSTAAAAAAAAAASPSVSLSLSPSEPMETGSADMGLNRFTLVQCCKELEEGRVSWAQHKKEATWRLSRLEQQLESEKARKRREKMEEVEAKIRCLREEEMAYLDRIEAECREQLGAIQRDAEAKEAKMVEMWAAKHLKLVKFVEQMGVHHHFSGSKDLH